MKPLKDDLTEMNMDPDLLERKPMLDGLTEIWMEFGQLVLTERTASPLPLAILDTVCSDALSFWKSPTNGWRNKLTSTYKKMNLFKNMIKQVYAETAFFQCCLMLLIGWSFPCGLLVTKSMEENRNCEQYRQNLKK